MSDAKNIAERIREIREERGFSRLELANFAGVPIRSLEKWEQGAMEPSWSRAVAIAQALSVDLSEFLKKPKPKKGRSPGRPPKVKAAQKEKAEEKPKKPRKVKKEQS